MRDYRPKDRKPTQFVGGKNFDYYLGIIILPILLIIVAEIIMTIFEVPRYFFWTIDVVSFIYVSWAIYLKRKDTFAEAGTAAAMMGIAIGLTMAIFKLIYFHKVYLIFNLIAEPIRTGLLGLVLVWLFQFILGITKRQPKSKGNDTYLSSLVKKIDHKNKF